MQWKRWRGIRRCCWFAERKKEKTEEMSGVRERRAGKIKETNRQQKSQSFLLKEKETAEKK